MAIYEQTKETTKTWLIDDSDSTWNLGEDAKITVGFMISEQYGIHDDALQSGNIINIMGDISADVPFGIAAISLLGDDSQVHIFESSVIKAGTYGILSSSENGQYVNDGSITANQFGIFASYADKIVTTERSRT
jgi:hypothetical protein